MNSSTKSRAAATARTARPGLRDGYRYFLAIPTRWMDNDSYGHVNNVTYYSYFDTAVNEHLIRVAGLDIARDPAIGLVVETLCKFRKALTFPDVVDAGLRVVKLGTSSVKYEIGLFRHDDPSPSRRGISCMSGSTARRSDRSRYRPPSGMRWNHSSGMR